MFYIASSIALATIKEVGCNSLNLSDPASALAFRAALCANHSLADADLDLYTLDEKDASAIAVMNGASYALVRTGGLVTGIDLTLENVKRIIKASASKSSILANGTDSLVVTIEVWKADNSGIDTAFGASPDVPVITPSGAKTVRIPFTAGVATRTFTTSQAGLWEIPRNLPRIASARIASIAKFESIATFASLT